jgi:hypothetical protein
MRAVNDALQSTGAAGFETQAILWLNGRIDTARLKSALADMSRDYPIMTSRLEDAESAHPVWRFRYGAECRLQEVTLATASRESVLSEAAALIGVPRDLQREDPISFHVLHLSTGCDVFVMQYNHTLMDNPAADLLLKEIGQRAASGTGTLSVASESKDAIAEYLSRKSLKQRVRAACGSLRLRLQSLRGQRTLLGKYLTGTRRLPAKILMRQMDEMQVRQLEASVMQLCHFPALSMALLSSALRAFGVHAPVSTAIDNLIVGLGVDLGLRKAEGPVFQNLSSVVPLRVQRKDLADSEGLLKTLNDQMRCRLKDHNDIGVIALTQLLRHFPRLLRWSTSRLMQRGYSFWYACFMSRESFSEGFCGTPVEDLSFVGPAWPPLGLTLIINQFRGRLRFQLTFLPDVVPEAVAAAFLDSVIRNSVQHILKP